MDEQIIASIQEKYRGPGGAIAVVQNGEVLFENAWGYADLDLRIPMTASAHLPICSITKQMVCLVLADLVRSPTASIKQRGGGDVLDQMTAELRNMLPQLVDHKDGKLTIADLYNMQSGIRDYWAMTTLWGARPDDQFRLTMDAPQILDRTSSFHFPPGTEWSYSNVNFYVLARLIEKVSGHSLGQLLSERVFIPAGMSNAALCPNTAGHPLPCVGYEGDEKHGYIPAINRMEWSGDAGVVATLQDMISYEQYLQRSWKDPNSIYKTIAQPQTYRDGSPATYGHGLAHSKVAEQDTLGHGGALRGFRLHRIHCPSANTSVVVMFNHEANAGGAAEDILKKLLDYTDPAPNTSIVPSPDWPGNYLAPETNLLINVGHSTTTPATLDIKYAGGPEPVKLTFPETAESRGMLAAIPPPDSDGNYAHRSLYITRLRENSAFEAHRLPDADVPPPSSADLAGDYRCEEVQSTFHIFAAAAQSGLMYGSFDGFLGRGPAGLMKYVGGDVWALACPRGLDAPAPGDWTCVFSKDKDGKVSGVTVGCWLARNIIFTKAK